MKDVRGKRLNGMRSSFVVIFTLIFAKMWQSKDFVFQYSRRSQSLFRFIVFHQKAARTSGNVG